MVGVIWYRFVRYSGTDWSDALVPIHPLQWYRFADIINEYIYVGELNDFDCDDDDEANDDDFEQFE